MSIDPLRPQDVAVAAHLLQVPAATYSVLADNLGISSSTAHEAVRRLVSSGLVRVDGSARRVNRNAFLEFLEHGVRYVFPGSIGPRTRGVPTAHSGPALALDIVLDEPVVWPDPSGKAIGASITPLVPKAAQLAGRFPETYEFLTAIDALRIGRARERSLAMNYIRGRLAQPTHAK